MLRIYATLGFLVLHINHINIIHVSSTGKHILIVKTQYRLYALALYSTFVMACHHMLRVAMRCEICAS